jgi:CheY-like chemotaxis protein
VKLDAIPASTVRLAAEIYLRHAYPGASRWRAPVPDLSGGDTAVDLLGRFGDESEEAGGRRVGRYVLRLGNSRYPHMKLVLEESILKNEYAFTVDTHDDLRISPSAPDFARWSAVRDHNRAVATTIEEAWREDEVPTLSDIERLLGTVEQLCDDAQQSVLVVDDDVSIRDAIRSLLERAGLRVATACNGKEALSSVAAHAPDLILMDYQMPEMDGVTACEALKADPATASIPVLLATRSQVDLAQLTFADGFLVKPYRQDVLFSLVRKLLA